MKTFRQKQTGMKVKMAYTLRGILNSVSQTLSQALDNAGRVDRINAYLAIREGAQDGWDYRPVYFDDKSRTFADRFWHEPVAIEIKDEAEQQAIIDWANNGLKQLGFEEKFADVTAKEKYLQTAITPGKF
jgi:hypothetical protein